MPNHVISYSSRIQTIRKLIVAFSFTFVLVIVTLLILQPKTQRVEIVYSDKSSDKIGIRITKPVLYSSNRSNRFFTLKATEGYGKDDKNLILNNITGLINLDDDGQQAHLSAGGCQFIHQHNQIILLDRVEFNLNNKSSMRTERAAIEAEQMIVHGASFVHIMSDGLQLEADSFRLSLNQQTALFEGSVHTMIN